jgi:putative CocE/NonD family hydrolase
MTHARINTRLSIISLIVILQIVYNTVVPNSQHLAFSGSDLPFLIMATQPRGFAASLLDRTATWLVGFPPETCNFSITPVKIPIGSDVERIELLADLYQPIQQSKPLGTILIRSPYGRAAIGAFTSGRAYAARGYQVLFVSSRGTFGSGGELDPFRTEIEDGLSVVTWMRRQDWYTGKFATMGSSYLAFTQFSIMCGEDKLEDMVAAVVHVGPHDITREWWGTGTLNMNTVLWANLVVEQEKGIYAAMTAAKKAAPLLNAVPLAQGVKDFFGDKVPWLERILAHGPNLKDPYYKPAQLEQALERASCPVLVVGGWYDLFIEQTFEQYTRLNERSEKVALLVGPWEHMGVGLKSTTIQRSFKWMEKHLAGRPQKDEETVQYYVTGAQEWRKTDAFPLPNGATTFYLLGGKGLSTGGPGSEVESNEFTYDPHDPTPTIGGNTLFRGGRKDDSALATRSDILTFTTDPLSEDLEVIGRIAVELSHSTDNPHADLFIRISDVDEKGKSFNIAETYKRLDPARKEGSPVKMTLDSCAHRFVKGRRIRLIIAGGCHPHWYRNTGVFDPNCTVGIEEMQSVKHTIRFGGGALSKVIFPLIGDAAK